ncbi:cobalamin biosynthesis protein CbiX [Paenibacillus sp. GSMTC-2017]|uniref:sirohydrochlorin chelatase n=1 Tax=Paenibacillus sp. GSMTC-2017 TaxID=2794350 RepID=UPI0018D5F72F|nr:CbiX/SirB N-terminal domain-containing protein [Paenibacillus sp. GSMTC-2017]MBH5319023.1 cobalamin biosynthesis protein CbiX [Paenibacillus sp. GSMTC-2017]
MKFGILIISHGSREAEWVRLVDEAVHSIATKVEAKVVSAFLEIVEGRLIQDGIDELERHGVTEIFVLPLFISSGSTHVDEIGQAFGLPPVSDLEGDLGQFRFHAKITYGKPIDDDPEIAELLLSTISKLSEDPSKEALLLIGHGSKEPVFHDRWVLGLSKLVERLRELGNFANGDYAMLLPDQASAKLIAMQQELVGKTVIVVPLFLSKGYFTNHVIPSRLEGLTYKYNGEAMLPHPAIERWLERRISNWMLSKRE